MRAQKHGPALELRGHMSDGTGPGYLIDKRPDKTKLAFWKSFLRHFFEKNFNVGSLKLLRAAGVAGVRAGGRQKPKKKGVRHHG